MRRLRTGIVGWVMLVVGVAGFPAEAGAEPFCKLYSITSHGDYARLYQSNGWQVHFEFAQSGNTLSGRAKGYSGTRFVNGEYVPIYRESGNLDGRVNFSDPRTGRALVYFGIQWTSGARGAYRASIVSGATVYAKRTGSVIDGTTWDIKRPASKATWRLSRKGPAATCVYSHPPGPPGPS